jgi:GNAT superfamily N-acetyltransferase
MEISVSHNISEFLGENFKDLIISNGNNIFTYWPYTSLNSYVDLYLDNLNKKSKNDFDIVLELKNEVLVFIRIGKQDWDTDHFGYNCCKIKMILVKPAQDINIFVNKIVPIVQTQFKKYLQKEHVRFLFADIDSNLRLHNILIQQLGFGLILTWIDGLKNSGMEHFIPAENMSFGELKSEEIKYFSDLSKYHYFKGGRFFQDTLFDSTAVQKMYAQLIENSANSDITLVARLNNRPVGLFVSKKIMEYKWFNSLKVAPLRFLIIDPEYRNQGVGRALFQYTLNYFSDKCDIITTGLEVNNIDSLNLHSKLGFKFSYVHYAYHFWNQYL